MKRDGVTFIEGQVSAGFEAVRRAFAENFASRGELGGACCVYYRGKKVVDLWGGVRDKASGAPWQEDTMVIVYRALLADFDRFAAVLARQRPAWPPGERQAYHAVTLGFYENELLRRIDPEHRSLGAFFQDEIATPLGLEFYIRLPESIPNARLATLAPAGFMARLRGFPPRFLLATLNPHARIRLALRGSELPHDPQHVYARNLEVASGGGVGTARAIARAYGAFATGGRELGLRAETLQALSAPAISPSRGFYDECMLSDGVQFSLGFMKSTPLIGFGSPLAFGAPGAGGAMGFADPKTGLGYGYVTSQGGTSLTGDPRDVALRDAVCSTIA